MNELIFLVADAPEGGFTARAIGHSIFTEAETMEELRQNVRDAVHCHFEEAPGSKADPAPLCAGGTAGELTIPFLEFRTLAI